jgi:hypothetical protein
VKFFSVQTQSVAEQASIVVVVLLVGGGALLIGTFIVILNDTHYIAAFRITILLEN